MNIPLFRMFAGNLALTAVLSPFSTAALGQNLTGIVAAGDTGAPIPGATVVAIQKTAFASQRPLVYKSTADAAGRYAMTVAPGQYQMCVHDAGLYLNPCQWDAANISTVDPARVVSAPLRLRRGAWFILRVHDQAGHLSQSEGVPHSGVTASLAGAGTMPIPLPVVYENGRVRDYGAVVPLNLPMRAVVRSSAVLLADEAGAAPSAQGVPFVVTAADISVPGHGRGFLRILSRRTAKMIHVYTTGRK